MKTFGHVTQLTFVCYNVFSATVEFKEIGQFILQVLAVFPEMSQRGEDL